MKAGCVFAVLSFAAHGSQLEEAVRRCDVPRVQQLIPAGVDLNEKVEGSNTALHVAVASG